MKRYSAKKRGWRSKRNGFSLLDGIIAIVVLLIAILGTASYRYHSALDERKAAMQTSATRVALLLCESWRGVQGATTCDPTTWDLSGVTISVGSGPAVPSDFTSLNSYRITTNNYTYTATLAWQNISAGLRALNVTLAWPTSGTGTANTSYALTSYTQY